MNAPRPLRFAASFVPVVVAVLVLVPRPSFALGAPKTLASNHALGAVAGTSAVVEAQLESDLPL